MKHKFIVLIEKEENWFNAKCIENNIVAQGKSIDESLSKLKESVELYYKENTEMLQDNQIFITTLDVFI